VPFNRVLELAPWLSMPQQRVPLLFHLDASSPPLSTIVNADWSGSNIKIYHDSGVPARFDLRVNRYEKETQVIVFFPDNPIARESVVRYIETLKSVFVAVAEDRGARLRNSAKYRRLLA
jgi:mycolipenoyl-CoA---2-(long-chain-fatty acyl)-trehalose mycolipenoyltransferase / long-chain-acyl-CoA---trehalose acyltransferase